uniref:Uncharacterized protein n=1 Tax=viral metagenome TaxID=1070528 RepID=A0A6C0F7T6_9ZZZZ|tara:strand:+ start:15970 stop:16779 length:810 start_codon:yes stop_codon:yes gene_type:complete
MVLFFRHKKSKKIIRDHDLIKRFGKYDPKLFEPIQVCKKYLAQQLKDEELADKILAKRTVRPYTNYLLDGTLSAKAKDLTPLQSIRTYLKKIKPPEFPTLSNANKQKVEKIGKMAKKKIRSRQIKELAENARNFSHNTIMHTKITPGLIAPHGWVLKYDWNKGRRNIYMAETIIKLIPDEQKRYMTRTFPATSRVLSHTYYGPVNDAKLNTYTVKSPFTREMTTPIRFNKAYKEKQHKNRQDYKGKYGLLKQMIKNHNKTSKEIISYYE